jgi:hypothetical protein
MEAKADLNRDDGKGQGRIQPGGQRRPRRPSLPSRAPIPLVPVHAAAQPRGCGLMFSLCSSRAMTYPRRFPPPWTIEERNECYIVVDGAGQKLAHLYFEDEPIRQGILQRLGKDDAWRIARAITRIPALLRRD